MQDGTIPIPKGALSLLKTELMSALEELSPLLDEPRAGPGPLDAGKALALFEKLGPMLDNINPQCVNLVDDIRAIPGADELARQIEDYDFESAARTLREIIEKWNKAGRQ